VLFSYADVVLEVVLLQSSEIVLVADAVFSA
jgi:hypothetical protein